MFDITQADHLLTTTRSVRRKLDLDRPVDETTILEMIDVAEQAPSGSNQTSRRWMVVRDPAQKERIATLYREAAAPLRDRMAGTVDPASRDGRVLDSAVFLAEHLERVPALVIATIYGVHDASGRPGLFDSVIQAAWSFCLAGRARGIGTAWTTLHLQRAAEVADVLGIPAGVTQVVLLPVATTDFHRAPRSPAEHVTFFDHWGFVPSSVPPDQRAHPGHGRGVSLDIDVEADEATVRAVVAELAAPRSEDFSLVRLGAGTRLTHRAVLGPDDVVADADVVGRLLALRSTSGRTLQDVKHRAETSGR